ncbi:MAG: TonB-dependent receptor domain-containing protein, partial [Acidimicrobiia bacterium]
KVIFSKELTPSVFGGTSVGDQGGFRLAIDEVGITNPTGAPTPSARNAPNWQFEDTLSWVKGSHNLSFGGSFTNISIWLQNQTMVPTVNFGIVTGDPADAMFNAINFPGASGGNLTDARELYAVLTGRIRQFGANARINEAGTEYVYLGPSVQRARMREFGFFAQDSWRVRPNLTLNYGVRWELQLPFAPLNSVYSTASVDDVFGISGRGNIFRPGRLEGQPTQYVQYKEGVRAYGIDWNNFAPNLGFAWTPSTEKGWLRRILGKNGDSVIRSGYSLAYNRNGIGDFTGVFDDNPGLIINVNRSLSLGNLGTLPLLFRERDRLVPPSFDVSPMYPRSGLVTDTVSIFDPNIQVPYAQSWTLGVQRA